MGVSRFQEIVFTKVPYPKRIFVYAFFFNFFFYTNPHLVIMNVVRHPNYMGLLNELCNDQNMIMPIASYTQSPDGRWCARMQLDGHSATGTGVRRKDARQACAHMLLAMVSPVTAMDFPPPPLGESAAETEANAVAEVVNNLAAYVTEIDEQGNPVLEFSANPADLNQLTPLSAFVMTCLQNLALESHRQASSTTHSSSSSSSDTEAEYSSEGGVVRAYYPPNEPLTVQMMDDLANAYYHSST
jgi:hypothetical protein